ncbi:hypothetical protein PHYPSEUDO_004228 [Phytophthora pseudosyringae]|uniref:Glutaredoxin 2 C-terminal domain-containing protein n=1 Tax=Phytophthora pseudosyringae TaxID=221518 RepID=A0A8T1VNP7_9STRA|nr:hypothetical protein PHYPSEUDO_004228 [Phytophthora pseudosyringae]
MTSIAKANGVHGSWTAVALVRDGVGAWHQEVTKQYFGVQAVQLETSHSTNEELSYDGLDVFGRLRALMLVKGIEWPVKVRDFMDYISEAGGVPMFVAVVKI